VIQFSAEERVHLVRLQEEAHAEIDLAIDRLRRCIGVSASVTEISRRFEDVVESEKRADHISRLLG
jgi:hypothetical protein